MGHYYSGIIKFVTVVLCMSILIALLIVMPSNKYVIPESVDKARELCQTHDGVKNIALNTYHNIQGTLFNDMRVTCTNEIVLEIGLSKEAKR